MNNLKTNPKGLDVSIQEVQKILYTKLTTLWGVDLNAYGRCYPYIRDNYRVIEYYYGSNDYKNLVYAEQNKFFFTAENDLTRTGDDFYTTNISLYFILNVNEIYPLVNHRADEEARVDVLKILNSTGKVQVTSVTTEINKVFSRFEYENTDDMQPYHCFKIDLDVLEFNINQLECN